MAKIYGLFGSMTGKLADVVMVVRNGAQLARRYQPIVSNPSTPAQVAARARLKLMSQLAEVMAPGIAFVRQGLVSARNHFVKANYALSSYSVASSRAEIALDQLDLSGGVIGIPAVSVLRATGGLSAQLTGAANFDAVHYIMVQTLPDGSIRFLTSQTVTSPGEGNLYPSLTIPFAQSSSGVLFAYGLRFNDSSARTLYGHLLTEGDTGFISVIRAALQSDYSLSETVSVVVDAGS